MFGALGTNRAMTGVASRVLSDPPVVLSPFLLEETNKTKPKSTRAWKAGFMGCQSQLCCFPGVGPGTSHIPSLSPSFIVCETWFLPPPPSQVCKEI